MDSLIGLLKDTPIPTILVVSGIIFLFLALAGSVAGKLEMPPARQKWSAVVSFVLLSAGLLLYVLPGSREAEMVATSPQGSPGLTNQPSAPTAPPTAPPAELAAAVPAASMATASMVTAVDPAELEGCLADFFTGIPAERIASLEVGASKALTTAPEQLSGIILEELGQPVAGVGFMLFEEDQLFKIIAAVDGACEPVGIQNSSRGGAGDTLQNWDTLEVTTLNGVYTFRFGYYAGEASVQTGKIQ